MNSIYIYHHLGLGDHIVCNGLVRYYAEKYDKTYVFCKPNNAKNVNKMYSDNSRIRLILMADAEVRRFVSISPDNYYLVVGHDKLTHIMSKPDNIKKFDEIFYEIANVPFSDKWDKFYYERDLKREKEVYYEILGLDDHSEFIFMHESNYDPITKEIPKDVKIIKPDNIEIGLFDYLYTIEKAKEVHVMNSSFMNLIDCIQLRQDGLFYHEYSRPNINAVLKLPWKILK